jgi:hypothetical protein
MRTGLFSSSSYSYLLVVDLTIFILYRLMYSSFLGSLINRAKTEASTPGCLRPRSSLIHSFHAIFCVDTSLPVEQVKYLPAKYFRHDSNYSHCVHVVVFRIAVRCGYGRDDIITRIHKTPPLITTCLRFQALFTLLTFRRFLLFSVLSIQHSLNHDL